MEGRILERMRCGGFRGRDGVDLARATGSAHGVKRVAGGVAAFVNTASLLVSI
jgi:hypothetical protein